MHGQRVQGNGGPKEAVCRCATCLARQPPDPRIEKIRDDLGKEWCQRVEQIDVNQGVQTFKTNPLPHTRVQKLMKADRDVQMIGFDALCMLTKASEFFVEELTKLSWLSTEDNTRKTIMKVDAANVIRQLETLDFLVDVINGTIKKEMQRARAEIQSEEANAIKLETSGVGASIKTEAQLASASVIADDAKSSSSQVKDV